MIHKQYRVILSNYLMLQTKEGNVHYAIFIMSSIFLISVVIFWLIYGF